MGKEPFSLRLNDEESLKPYVSELPSAAEQGVEELIKNYRDSFELTMGLWGYWSITQLKGDRIISR